MKYCSSSSGNIRLASAAEMIPISIRRKGPGPGATRSQSIRSRSPASVSPPFMWMPQFWPERCSISRYSPTVYCCSFATLGSPLSVCMPPAACQVEPAVSSLRSTSTTSVQPSSVRWYRTEAPITPPPMTTTCAEAFIQASLRVSFPGTVVPNIGRSDYKTMEVLCMGRLLDRLAAGPVICAEGYLFEFERRGYLQAGAFVPEVVLEEPEMVAGLHREFVHAGSDVVEGFTYYAQPEKLAVIGREGDLERMNRQALRIAKEGGAAHDSLVAGNICNTNVS